MMTERYVFWCGAGISIESRMPSGPHLTAAWLRHHLPDGEADHILDLFKRHGDLFGKDLPRLEKIVGTEILWCAAEAGLYFQSFATKLPHGWLLFPFVVPPALACRAKIMRVLRVLLDGAEKWPDAVEPHLAGNVARLGGFIAADAGWPMTWFESRLHPEGLPVPDFIDATGSMFQETDSLLGLVNFQRNLAIQHLHASPRGLVFPRLEQHLRIEVQACLRRSKNIAIVIGDRPVRRRPTACSACWHFHAACGDAPWFWFANGSKHGTGLPAGGCSWNDVGR